MSAPNFKKQKAGWATLDGIFRDAANVWVVHYSCESFYDRPNGASPRISSIAVRKLDSGQTVSFSIHQVAEQHGVAFDRIDTQYDPLEKHMLDAFYAHVRGHQGMKYLHWNMRDINYGFAAIEHRYRVLDGEPFVISDDKKFDLSRLFIDIYGKGYADHHRLTNLLKANGGLPRDFLSGEEEAHAFDNRNFVALHQSTLRKAGAIADLAELSHQRQLKTKTSWWDMHGGRARAVFRWLAGNKGIALIASVASIAGLALTVYTLR